MESRQLWKKNQFSNKDVDIELSVQDAFKE